MLQLEKRLQEKGLTVNRGTSTHVHTGAVSQRKDSALEATRILAASTKLQAKCVHLIFKSIFEIFSFILLKL